MIFASTAFRALLVASVVGLSLGCGEVHFHNGRLLSEVRDYMIDWFNHIVSSCHEARVARIPRVTQVRKLIMMTALRAQF